MSASTLVVTTFNDAEYLPRALSSAMACGPSIDSVVVVDDGSATDEAEAVVQRFASRFRSIVYHRQQNQGPAAARNVGVDLSGGDLLLFLDADDQLLPDGVRRRSELLASRPKAYFGSYGSFRIAGSNRVPKFQDVDGELNCDVVGQVGGHPGGAPAFVFRRSHFEDVGGFDVGLRQNEDFDLVCRLAVAGGLCVGQTFPIFVRTRRPDSLSRGGDPYARRNDVVKFLAKAESLGYLSLRERRRRLKHAGLGLARDLRNAGSSRQQVALELRNAFEASAPSGATEVAAWIYSRIFSEGF